MSNVKVWMHTNTSQPHRKSEHEFAHLKQPPVYRPVMVQFAVSAILLLALLPVGITAAVSAFLGGLCGAIPHVYFVRQAFRYQGARSAKLIANSFYKGEAGKLVLTFTAFTLVFVLVSPLDPLALFSGYVLVLLVNWFTPLLIKKSVKIIRN